MGGTLYTVTPVVNVAIDLCYRTIQLCSSSHLSNGPSTCAKLKYNSWTLKITRYISQVKSIFIVKPKCMRVHRIIREVHEYSNKEC